MDSLNHRNANAMPAHSFPVHRADGTIVSAGAIALSDAMRRGAARGVTDLMRSMDVAALARSLRETGMNVSLEDPTPTQASVFESVRADLQEGLALKTDGHGLNRWRQSIKKDKSQDNAARTIQRLLRHSRVHISLAGPDRPAQRASLQFIAGQALGADIQGFGFDGIQGKYQVSFGLHEVMELHGEAARAVAKETAQSSLARWANGDKVNLGGHAHLIGDSVQQRLAGSVSLASAKALVDAIANGTLENRAQEVGMHQFTGMMARLGLDVSSKTVEQQAAALGMNLREADRERGTYFGPVVGQDHRASLVKITRQDDALVIPFADLPRGQAKPHVGDAVALRYNAGELTITIAKAVERAGAAR